MKPLQQARAFFSSLLLLVIFNLVVKPLWVFGIDRQVQNITGLEAYGNYFALLNLAMVMQFLLDLGITPYFNKQISAEPSKARVLASQAFTIKAVLSTLYTIAVFAVAAMTGVQQWGLVTMLIFMQILTTYLLLLRAYLTGSQLFAADAWVSVTDKIFVILAAGGLMLFPGISGGITIRSFVIIQSLGILLAIAIALLSLYRGKKELLLVTIKMPDASILSASLPFALNIFFMTALMRADGFLLDRLLPDGAFHAGVYASAFRLTDAVNMGGFLLAGFLLPFISRIWPDIPQVSLVLRACRFFLLSPAIVLACLGWFKADEINNLLYHAREPEAARVIAILLPCLVPLAFIQVYGTHLTATGHIKTFLRISGAFALLNIVLNLFFIPAYGSTGAAWVALATQSAFALVTTYYAVYRTGIRFHGKDLLYYVLLLALTVLIFKWLIL